MAESKSKQKQHDEVNVPGGASEAKAPEETAAATAAEEAAAQRDQGGQDADGEQSASLEQQLQRLEEELALAHDGALRAQAELENFRKRSFRELEEERKYACLPLMRDVLPVVDNLNRAIQAAEQNDGSSGLLDGVKMVAQQLLAVLEQHQCKRIEAQGATFDPNMHEAIGQLHCDTYPSGAVAEVALEGYQLHNRVVRPPQVLVSLGPAEEDESN
jgi:molecular chaperone GrpE